MCRVMLIGAAIMSAVSPAVAQHWIPPRPGQSVCSGWDTAEARETCQAKEARSAAAEDAARSAERARTQAIIDAEAKRIAAEHAATGADHRQVEAKAAHQRELGAVADREAATAAEARMRSFDFGADEFGPLISRSAWGRGDYLPTRLSSCSQPDADGEGICEYQTPPGVNLVVSSWPSAFRARLITVTWDGQTRGMVPFARTVLAICYAFAPQEAAQEAIARAKSLLTSISPADTWQERRWTSGRTAYAIRPDPKLGARGSVIFTAEDLGD